MSTLTITTIQTSLFWEDKSANLDMFEKKIAGIKEKTELILLPEMFNTGFSMRPVALAETMDGVTVTWMKKMALKEKAIVAGSLIIAEQTSNGTAYYNRLVWMLPNGNYGVYDK